jgi:hypothetical protein
LDVDRILTGGVDECSALQAVLPSVACCSLQAEFPDSAQTLLTSGVVKVFRLAQLIIQYLLHSQERLAEAVEALQRKNRQIEQVRRISLFRTLFYSDFIAVQRESCP